MPHGGFPCALPLCYTGLHLLKFNVTCAMTTSFCKADEEFIHPNNFDLVISGLIELKIHIGCRRIRTSDMTLSVCLFVETIDYHSAMRLFCNHLLEMNVSLSIYKDVDMNFMTKM